MSDKVVLDTDVVVDVLRGRAGVIRRLAGMSPDHLGVTAMSVAELRYGALASADPRRNQAEVDRFLAQVRVLPFGNRSAAVHARLRYELRTNPIGPNDLVIAATTLAAGATLVTSNAREFERVSGLRVEHWR